VDLVHLTLNDLHYYHYGPSGPPHYLSSYLTGDYKGPKRDPTSGLSQQEEKEKKDDEQMEDIQIDVVICMNPTSYFHPSG
jgi:hypothetical protein